VSAKKTLPERIDDILFDSGRMSFHDLAMALYPDKKSWRYQQNGGPPGCYMALSAALRRGKFYVDYTSIGPGRRMVYARS